MKYTLLLLLAYTALNPLASSQELLYRFDGSGANDYLGKTTACAGDVNNDGFDDIIVGAPEADVLASNDGEAIVFSGADGTILYRMNGSATNDQFGYSVCSTGDINKDGYADFAVGAPYDDDNGTDSGSVWVYSGINGDVLFSHNGDSSGALFGWCLDGDEDLNQDGYPDWVVGAPGDDYIRSYSGRFGTSFFKVTGSYYAGSIALRGDINGDTYQDIIVGSDSDRYGAVEVLSGLQGSVLYQYSREADYDYFGSDVDGAGDIDNDGLDDFMIGARHRSSNGSDSGQVYFYSGATGDLIDTINGNSASDYFGWSLANVGDIDGDTYDDYLIGAPYDDPNGADSGSVDLYSGKDRMLLFRFQGPRGGDKLGWSVAAGGDLNNDGQLDLLFGAAHYDSFHSNSGAAFAHSGYKFKGDWPNLPMTTVPVNMLFQENFDSRAGILPNHFSLSFTDATTLKRDPDALCNIGNMEDCRLFQSGEYSLEMGLRPGTNNYHDVFNALVIGLDGLGSGGHLLSFSIYNCGENAHQEDGVWVSSDGLTWENVYPGWAHLPAGQWVRLENINLSNVGVSTQGSFYLRFSQRDNFPYFYNEGVAIDDIEVVPSVTLSVDNLTAGGFATVQVDGCTPNGQVWINWSMAGPGPTPSPWGLAYLAPPIHRIVMQADNGGMARLVERVPYGVTGRPMHIQAVDIIKGVLTNPISDVIK
jgi:hypothetical protein